MYGSLRNGNTGNPDLDDILQDFISLEFEQVFVLLFAAGKYYGKNSLVTDDYKNLVNKLFSLIIRMQVCDKSTNSLDVLFSRCIENMTTKNVPLTDITEILQVEINTNVNDTIFRNAFAMFAPSSNKISEVYCRYIENKFRSDNGNRIKLERGLSLEHIIPQTVDFNDWYGPNIDNIPDDIYNDFKNLVIESIGNKMLLFGDDNSSANNNDYSKKLNVYNNGKRGSGGKTPIATFETTRDLVKRYPNKFDHDDVFERANYLADMAINIWV